MGSPFHWGRGIVNAQDCLARLQYPLTTGTLDTRNLRRVASSTPRFRTKRPIWQRNTIPYFRYCTHFPRGSDIIYVGFKNYWSGSHAKFDMDRWLSECKHKTGLPGRLPKVGECGILRTLHPRWMDCVLDVSRMLKCRKFN